MSGQFDEWERDTCPHCRSSNLTERAYPVIVCDDCRSAFFAHEAESGNHITYNGEFHRRDDLDFPCVLRFGGQYELTAKIVMLYWGESMSHYRANRKAHADAD